MGSLGQLIPLLILFVTVGVIAFIGYQVRWKHATFSTLAPALAGYRSSH